MEPKDLQTPEKKGLDQAIWEGLLVRNEAMRWWYRTGPSLLTNPKKPISSTNNRG